MHKERLLAKLDQKGLRDPLLRVVSSWLDTRTAHVVVEATRSQAATLKNQVFQGTVWGPPLWNVFFEDARRPVQDEGFADSFFADDLNCYKDFARKCSNDVVYEELAACQRALHRWGGANRVQFDASKESMHVLDRRQPEGDGFGLLGVEFDEALEMHKEIDELATRCHWKLRTLLRSQRCFTVSQLVDQYKAHVLPFVEHSTPAVYHATKTVLEPLDRVQRTFLRRLELTEQEALANYNLAPLSTRRDLAMLGLVHRTVLGESPPQFAKWFFPAGPGHTLNTRLRAGRHCKQLHDYLDGTQTALLRRSALALPRVYNSLPEATVLCKTVKDFQGALQKEVKRAAKAGVDNWQSYFSPRRETAVDF